MASLEQALRAADDAVNVNRLELDPSPLETFLGLDAVDGGNATLQAVVHLRGNQRGSSTASTTIKLYPAQGRSDRC